MKFFAYTYILAAAAAVLAVPASETVGGKATLSYDQTYDNPNGDLHTVACSNGPNGLLTKGYTTFSTLPGFPNIGGVFGVTWNSPNCGTCWKVTYAETGKSINVLAVDHAGDGTFNVALAAMNKLTNNQAVALGRVPVTYTQVPITHCH